MQTDSDAPSSINCRPSVSLTRRDFGASLLTTTGSGGSAFADRIDEGSSHFAVDDFIGWHAELQQAHRTFDVDSDRPRINVRWRNHHASDGSSVTDVCIGIQDEIRDARSQP